MSRIAIQGKEIYLVSFALNSPNLIRNDSLTLDKHKETTFGNMSYVSQVMDILVKTILLAVPVEWKIYSCLVKHGMQSKG